MNDLLSNLNPVQRTAVTAEDGPLLVIAGAGSGKTRVLAHRIAYLVSKGIHPNNILAVTFTNKAAGEMKERIRQLISPLKTLADRQVSLKNTTPWVGTFHALGVYILRRDGQAIGIPRTFTILDEDDSLSVIKHIIKERQLDPKQFQPSRIRNTISALKNMPFSADPETTEEEHAYPREIKEIIQRYNEELEQMHALDFDDLLLKPVELFRKHQTILATWQAQWHSVLVDEYQDTNHIQCVLIKLLTGPPKGSGNITAVGDADQAIYGWRGATIKNILSFERDWPNAKVIALEQNYRSTPVILETANAVIQKNKERKEKTLWTDQKEGPLVELFIADNEQREAQFVTQKIKQLRRASVPLREIALLYRTNAQSRVLEEACIRSNIPYRLIGGIRFYERREIKDILAYMRLATNPQDRVSMRRVLNTPPRGIGSILTEKYLAGNFLSPKEQARIDAFWLIIRALSTAYQTNTPSHLARKAIAQSSYETYVRDGTPEGEERWANVQELFTVTSIYNNADPPRGTDAFLEQAALLADADLVDQSADAVHLMTIHAAKGLEFDNVFITGLEDGIFPHNLSMHDNAQMEEERRLCYVALTRARTRLFISAAQTRAIYGETLWNEPSRFLRDIPKHLIKMHQPKETNYLDTEDAVQYE